MSSHNVLSPAPRGRGANRSAAGPDGPGIWVLLGRRAGDNLQMRALAEATRMPVRLIQLEFNALSAVPNIVLGRSRISIASKCADTLRPPWPAVVISSGRRAVPVARWIQAQADCETRLVHVGRPWGPLSWFDLIVTTPQYGLPRRSNVRHLLMPLISQERLQPGTIPRALRTASNRLPRPWTAVFIGGSSRPFVLDARAAGDLARLSERRAGGGSVLFVPGPRTAADVMQVLQGALAVPSLVCERHEINPYPAVRALADRFVVTEDSAAMVAELISTGKPVYVFPLPRIRDLRCRINSWFAAAARRVAMLARARNALIEAGLVTSVRDLSRYLRALRQAGLFDSGTAALQRQEAELAGAAVEVRRLAGCARPEAAGSRRNVTELYRHGKPAQV